jgi:hypothetical protein
MRARLPTLLTIVKVLLMRHIIPLWDGDINIKGESDILNYLGQSEPVPAYTLDWKDGD